MDKLQINVNKCTDADAFHPAGKKQKQNPKVMVLLPCRALSSFESTLDDLFQLFFFSWLYILVSCVLFWTNFVIPLFPSLTYDINVWHMFTIHCVIIFFKNYHLIHVTNFKEEQLARKLTSNIPSCVIMISMYQNVLPQHVLETINILRNSEWDRKSTVEWEVPIQKALF